MSASSQIRIAGLSALIAVSGEALSYGATNLKGLVNRSVAKVRDAVSSRDGQLDFSVLGMTEIEVMRSAMALPVAGKNFVDSLDVRHRVRYVTQTDISWVCYCTPAPVV